MYFLPNPRMILQFHESWQQFQQPYEPLRCYNATRDVGIRSFLDNISAGFIK